MPLLDEALTYVLANTTGFQEGGSTGADIPIYLNYLPPDPDVALALYEPGGAPPLAALNTSVPVVEQPRIQLTSRALTYRPARNNAQTVWDVLFALVNVDIAKTGSTGTTAWKSAEPVNSPVDTGRDSNERNIVTADFQLQKEMS
jgi:hypothetical protein